MSSLSPVWRRVTTLLPLVGVLFLLAVPTLVLTSSGAPMAPAAAPHEGPAARPAPAPVALAHVVPRPHPVLDRIGRGLFAVNPYQYYSSQPAPMGIGDFGLNGAGQGVVYNTSAFLGDVDIRNLQVDNPGIQSTTLTIQLNIVLQFYQGGAWYYYWIQDVAFLNTTNNQVWFENNIWNFSGSLALNSDSVTGNGTIYGGEVYIAGALATLPGNLVDLSYPANILLLAKTDISRHLPQVDFEYRDGTKGWVTYDNVVFPFAYGATDVNYTVNGTGYNPETLYSDAELTLGGPGGGANTSAQKANLTMSLAFYNGENYQSVPNALDFGSDTAEAISNLHPQLEANPLNGSLSDNLTYGAPSVGQLYDNATVSDVFVQTLVPGGDLVINGTTGLAFAASPINVTLGPGRYEFQLYEGTTLKASTNLTLVAGEFLELFLDAGTISTVTFEESGLTTGHGWTIGLGPFRNSSRTWQIGFVVINGSYRWQLQEMPGWIANVTNGTVDIEGGSVVLYISFVEVFYKVTLFELGLPNNTTWSITVANQTLVTSHPSLTFQLPNGTFPYYQGYVPGWNAESEGHGQFVIEGAALTRTITFHPFTFTVSFAQSGLPHGTTWSMEVNGSYDNDSVPVLLFYETNGSFAYTATGPGGYIAENASGVVQVDNASVLVNISFVAYRLPVTFQESGLASGTTWGVTIGSVYLNSSTDDVVFELINGTYSYTASPVAGYDLAEASANLSVDGAPLQVNLTYVLVPLQDAVLSGTLVPAGAVLLLNQASQTVNGGSFRIDLVPGNYALEAEAPGYHPFFANYTLAPGEQVVVPIHLKPLPTTPTGSSPPPGGQNGGNFLGLTEVELVALLALVIGGPLLLVAVLLLRRRP